MKSNGIHLVEKQRDQIEIMLNEGKLLKEIAAALGRDPRGIKYEIVTHRQLMVDHRFKNSCGLQASCSKSHLCNSCTSGKCKYCSFASCSSLCNDYSPYPNCKTCLRFPYVCNGCKEVKHCTLPKFYYKSHQAQLEYAANVTNWKIGTRLNDVQLKELDRIVSEGVKRGLSLDVIIQTNHLNLAVTTLYRLIDQQLLSVKNIDLKRKVRYHQRTNSKPKAKPIHYDYLKGRTFSDFQEYYLSHPEANIWQMDTVEGIRGGAAVLTLLHTKSRLQLLFKIKSICMEEVIRVFDAIKSYLSIEVFQEVFECFLTDNGKEFKNPESLIIDSITGESLSAIYYCEARRSDQKGTCEKNHEHFREFIPKGIDIGKYSNTDMNRISNNVNNYPRRSMAYKSPLEVFLALGLNKKTLELNHLTKLESSKVELKRLITK